MYVDMVSPIFNIVLSIDVLQVALAFRVQSLEAQTFAFDTFSNHDDVFLLESRHHVDKHGPLDTG